MRIENREELKASRIEFDEHVRKHLIYPSLINRYNRFLNVRLNISINEEGNLDHVRYKEEKRKGILFWVKPIQKPFINEALKIVTSFKNWVPNKVEREYQKTDRTIEIYFHYHKRIASDSNIILNPHIRAFCLDNTWRTNSTIKGINGCDGNGMVLAIIDEKGNPQEIETYHIQGKTNARILEKAFKDLGRWSPAILNGKKVKSQVNLMVYT